MTQKLFAFDFDGVICDSAVETGMAGWHVATQYWTDMPEAFPASIAEGFKQVRPVMETGYEAILIVRWLFEGISPEKLLSQFQTQIDKLILRDELSVDELKMAFGAMRDQWIEEDLTKWISLNPLFPGLKEKLQSIPTENLVIITTKQERFVDYILKANDVELPMAQIYGLDRGLSKPEILFDLIFDQAELEVIFIEDRLPTLLDVMDDPRLHEIKLFLAEWGYNTDEDKDQCFSLDRIKRLSLENLVSL